MRNDSVLYSAAASWRGVSLRDPRIQSALVGIILFLIVMMLLAVLLNEADDEIHSLRYQKSLRLFSCLRSFEKFYLCRKLTNNFIVMLPPRPIYCLGSRTGLGTTLVLN